MKYCKDDPYHHVGETIDNCCIKGLVAIGGMGAVYHAYQSGTERFVALKVLRPELIAGESERDGQYLINSFQREAMLMGKLMHANIATIYSSGVTGNTAYIVMEWLGGPTLKEEIAARGHLDLPRTAKIIRQIASALQKAHTITPEKIIHRDIKPANVMFVRRTDGQGTDDEVKVVDFGIGKTISDKSKRQSSYRLGTDGYAAPEQYLGGEITEKADIYSLGITLYEMLTGKPTFTHEITGEIMGLHLAEMPPSVCVARSDVPREVDDFIKRMLAKIPTARPAANRLVVIEHTAASY